MFYAAIAVAILVLLVLFKIMKGLLKLLLLIIIVLAGVYYFQTHNTAEAEKEETQSVW